MCFLAKIFTVGSPNKVARPAPSQETTNNPALTKPRTRPVNPPSKSTTKTEKSCYTSTEKKIKESLYNVAQGGITSNWDNLVTTDEEQDVRKSKLTKKYNFNCYQIGVEHDKNKRPIQSKPIFACCHNI